MELKVIGLVCQENSTEEIAAKLGIGKRTVEGHRRNIIKKMGVRNSVGILFFAIKNGLFQI
ncbi:MAG: helix-turn-helix transcriptional regulator [Flavisolibacter sp.]|nr:helix-turn-helix transcriptional regulator [Flavisolibacter sp.]